MMRAAIFEGHGPDAPLDLGGLAPAEEASIVGRLRDGSMLDLSETLARVGNCRRPVRLTGHSHTVDAGTGEILSTFRSSAQPMGLLYKPCGNRRDEVCPSCSRVYARDTLELISTGLHGGKGVPTSVKANPLLFVTLTAPSFGAVHRVYDGRGPCRPRSRIGVCEHGVRFACWAHHQPGDPLIGAPVCNKCYDVESAVVWQWHAPELWRRFTITLRRHVAKALGIKGSHLRRHARLEYAKVAEFQARGLVHFHALVRVDGPDGPGSPVPITASRLRDVVAAAAAAVVVTAPPVDEKDVARELHLGVQTDVRVVREGGVVGDEITAEQVAAYLAKYATKSAGVDPSHPAPHHERIMQMCRSLAARALTGCPFGCDERAGDRHPRLCGDCEENPYALLGHWSTMLGFRGHFSTKSRHYSVTLGRLRARRPRAARLLAEARRRGETLDTRDLEARLLADEEETTLVVGAWTFQGTGWPRIGDTALADAAAARAREYAQWRAEHRHEQASTIRERGNPR